MKRFFDEAKAALRAHSNVTILNAGLGGSMRVENFHVQNDSTGIYAGAPDVEKVMILSVREILPRERIDLLKLNVEGMEYEILESLLDSGSAARFANIQVQFHTVAPDWKARYDAIAEGLSKTHEITWRAPWVWENWKLLG